MRWRIALFFRCCRKGFGFGNSFPSAQRRICGGAGGGESKRGEKEDFDRFHGCYLILINVVSDAV